MSKNVVGLPESLRSIVNAVEDIRCSLNEIGAHTRQLDDALGTIRYELERQASVQERTSRELQQLKNAIAQMKTLKGAQTITDVPPKSISVHNVSLKAPKTLPAIKTAIEPALNVTDGKATEPMPAAEAAYEPAPEGHSHSNNAQAQTTSFWQSGYSFPDNVSTEPVMSGNGFSQVTWSYLRKLSDKNK